MEYETRIASILIIGKVGDVFDEGAITVRIEDEAAGEFLVLEQSTDEGLGVVKIDGEEWPTLRDAIDRMHAQCRGDVQ